METPDLKEWNIIMTASDVCVDHLHLSHKMKNIQQLN